MDTFIKHIASELKEACREKNLSQEALALQVGLPQSHLSKIEKGSAAVFVEKIPQTDLLYTLYNSDLMQIPFLYPQASQEVLWYQL